MAKNQPLISSDDADRKTDNFHNLIKKLAKLSEWPEINIPPFKIPNWPSGYTKSINFGERKITIVKIKGKFLELEAGSRNIRAEISNDGSVVFAIDGSKDKWGGNTTDTTFSTNSADLPLRLIAMTLLFQFQEDIIARLNESIDEHFNSLDVIRSILKPYAPAMVADQLSK